MRKEELDALAARRQAEVWATKEESEAAQAESRASYVLE